MTSIEGNKHFLYKVVIGETKNKENGIYLYVLADSVWEAVKIVKMKRPHFFEVMKRIEEVRNWDEKERIWLTEVIL